VGIDTVGFNGGTGYWLTGLSREGNTLDLQLKPIEALGERHETFKLPAPGTNIGYLGETPYTSAPRRYPETDEPCREGGQ
jgi:hypothetical protein